MGGCVTESEEGQEGQEDEMTKPRYRMSPPDYGPGVLAWVAAALLLAAKAKAESM